MRSFSLFSFKEWLKLQPLSFLWKQLRNDSLLFIYKRVQATHEDEYLARYQELKDKNLLIIIAFEQLKVLEWLFFFARRNLLDFQLLIFDNSRSQSKRLEIQQLCLKNNIPYLALPLNNTKHPNRSHGMAMSWVFHRIIRKLQPKWFGYLDHDMIPVQSFDFHRVISSQLKCYGTLNEGYYGYWNLWAGYCFFKFRDVAHLPLNFLYDFSRGTDTGGRNWDCFYSLQDRSPSIFASDQRLELFLSNDLKADVQVIDDAWIHIGGVSYNNNLAPKEEFYEALIEKFKSGVRLVELQK